MSWITGCSLSPQQFPLPPSHGLFIFHLCFPGSQGPHILHQADRQQVTPSPTVGAVLCLVTRSCLTVTPWTVAHQAPLSMGILPGKNTGVGCHALLQGIFPTQMLNPGLPPYRQILYHLGHQGSP